MVHLIALLNAINGLRFGTILGPAILAGRP